MGDNKRDILNDVVGNTVFEVLRVLLLALAVGVVAAAGAIARRSDQLPPFMYLFAGLVLGVAIGIGVTVLTRRIDSRSVTLPRVQGNYKCTLLSLHYAFSDATHMTFTKRWEIKALRNGVDRLEDRFRWTGSGPITIGPANPNQGFRITGRRSIWQTFEVTLERQLKRGDSAIVELVWELEDSAGTAVPFFSTTIDTPTDELHMSLDLPASSVVTSVVVEKHRTISSQRPFWTDALEVNRHKDVTWIVRNPRLLYYYEMNWKEPAIGKVNATEDKAGSPK